MSTLWALITVLSVLAFFGGLGMLPFRSTRQKGKIVFGFSLVTFFVGAILFGRALDTEAVTAGFDGDADRRTASEAGYSDPATWQPKKVEILEQKKREAEEKKRIEDARAAEIAEQKKREAEEKQRREAEQRAAQEAQCRSDLRCWGDKFMIEAGFTCGRYVERLARNDFEWINSSFEPKVSHFKWRNKPKGIITYVGDKIKFQNGFGAWIIHTYECDFDPNAKKVLDVRARPGRIPIDD